jgi:hypothetical protein
MCTSGLWLVLLVYSFGGHCPVGPFFIKGTFRSRPPLAGLSAGILPTDSTIARKTVELAIWIVNRGVQAVYSAGSYLGTFKCGFSFTGEATLNQSNEHWPGFFALLSREKQKSAQ